MKLRVLIAGLMFGVAAFAAETGAELFQKAVTQERAAGNLEEAIKLYQRVAREFASDRALAAKALVQEARCYEKLGQDKAVKLYEQVARDFGDQRELAGTARERLAAISAATRPKSTPGMVARQIPALTSGRLKQSDGRHVFYISRDGLVVSGMDGRGAKVIFPNPPGAQVNAGVITNFVVSRDGKQIVFGLLLKGNKESIWVVGVDGSGSREVYDMNQLGARPMSSASGLRGRILDWSPDGSHILAAIDQEDQTTALMSISASDGSARALASGAFLSPAKFSPDGKYVAYTVNGVLPPFLSPEMDIDIVAVDGSYSGKLVEHPGADKILDWTPDGAYILFLSDRTGEPSLFALAVSQGRPQGDPILVKQDSGNMGYASMARDGSLYYLAGSGSHHELFLASVDPVLGTVSGNPRRVAERAREHQPGGAWSSDGRFFAYAAGGPERASHRLIVRTTDSGQERQLVVDGVGSGILCWAPDNATLYVVGLVDRDQQFSIRSVSATTGEAKQIAVYPKRKVLTSLSCSHDGKALLIGFRDVEPVEKSLPPRAFVLRHDLATGEEAELISKDGASDIAMSPDGTRAAALDFQRGEDASVSMKPLNGGDWTRTATIAGRRVESLQWMPDGSAVVFSALDSTSSVLFAIPAEGGNLRRMGEFPQFSSARVAAIHPDGQLVLFSIGILRSELWALENLVPNLATLAAKAKPAEPANAFARQIPIPTNARRDALTVFSDGAKVYYLNDSTGDLMVGGMDGRAGKPVYKVEPGQSIRSYRVSADGRQIALGLWGSGQARFAVAATDGSGFHTVFEKHYAPSNSVVVRLSPATVPGLVGDWSPDSSRFLASIVGDDGSGALVSISAADGAIRQIASLDRSLAYSPKLSPDGRYVAYSAVPGWTAYVVPTGGGQPVKIVDDTFNRVVGWTPDGRYLLFDAVPAPGENTLYAIAVSEGRPAGKPIPIAKVAGAILNSSITKDGSLVYSSIEVRPDIQIVRFDPKTGAAVGEPEPVSVGFVDNWHAADWSADGKQLAYTSTRVVGGRHEYVLTVRTIESGKENEFVLGTASQAGARVLAWSADGAAIYFVSLGSEAAAMERIILKTGLRKQMGTLEKGRIIDQWRETPDGRSLLIGFHDGASQPRRAGVLQLDINSGRITELITREGMAEVAISPDGSRAAAAGVGMPDNASSLSIGPIAGGEWKELTKEPGYGLQWAPDGAALYYRRETATSGLNTLYRIPAGGGEPLKLVECHGVPFLRSRFQVHPDGQQALFLTTVARSELWAIRNVLSKLSASR